MHVDVEQRGPRSGVNALGDDAEQASQQRGIDAHAEQPDWRAFARWPWQGRLVVRRQLSLTFFKRGGMDSLELNTNYYH